MAAFLDRVHELLTAVGEQLAAVPTGGDRDQADDGQRESKADHHAEDENKHPISVAGSRPGAQIDPRAVTQL